MFKKEKKENEKVLKAKEEKNEAMQELGDEELGELSGAGDPFASHPRVPTKGIDSSLRKNG